MNKSTATNARPNIREVAKEAGVSPATVSRALQTPERLSPETLAKVEQVIRRLNYHPNAQAQMMRTAKTRMIVALVPDISNPFFSAVIRGIEQVAYQNEYSVLLGDLNYDRLRERQYVELLQTRRVDGLLTLLPHLPDIRMSGAIPVVNACEIIDDDRINSVFSDNVGGARSAVTYLASIGHRRIAMINGPDNLPVSRQRYQGYTDALREQGIPLDPDIVFNGEFSVETGIRLAEDLLAQPVPVTAIFCANDEIAIGAITAAKRKQLSVPEDLSIIGFDDIRLSQYYSPPLTTVSQPMYEMGREAMTILLDIIENPNRPPRKRMLPTWLTVRESSGPPRVIPTES